MKLNKRIYIVVILLFILSGCSTGLIGFAQTNTPQADINTLESDEMASSDDAEEHDYADYTPEVLYPEGIKGKNPLTLNQATDKLLSKIELLENQVVQFEQIDFINSRVYYIFRIFEDNPEQMVTSKYDAVDVLTGQVYKTFGLTDLIEIP